MVEKKESGFVRWLKSLSKTQIRAGFVIYFVVIYAFLLVPPLFSSVVNKVYPMILGMPRVVFITFLIWVLAAIGMSVLFEIESIRRDFR